MKEGVISKLKIWSGPPCLSPTYCTNKIFYYIPYSELYPIDILFLYFYYINSREWIQVIFSIVTVKISIFFYAKSLQTGTYSVTRPIEFISVIFSARNNYIWLKSTKSLVKNRKSEHQDNKRKYMEWHIFSTIVGVRLGLP